MGGCCPCYCHSHDYDDYQRHYADDNDDEDDDNSNYYFDYYHLHTTYHLPPCPTYLPTCLPAYLPRTTTILPLLLLRRRRQILLLLLLLLVLLVLLVLVLVLVLLLLLLLLLLLFLDRCIKNILKSFREPHSQDGKTVIIVEESAVLGLRVFSFRFLFRVTIRTTIGVLNGLRFLALGSRIWGVVFRVQEF